MAHMRVKLIATGGRAGQTCKLGNYQFVDGITFVEGNADQVDGMCTYLGRCYKAWPEGSQELAYFQKLDQERTNGTGKVHAASEQRLPGSVSARVQSPGRGSQEIPPAARAGTDEAPGADTAGGLPSGDGQQDAGDAEEDFRTRRLSESVMSLDPTNDEHWTADGRPRMDAVEKAFGSADVNRGDVNQALPGYNREAAANAAA